MVLELFIKDVSSEGEGGRAIQLKVDIRAMWGVDQMWMPTFHDQVLGFLSKAMSNITKNIMVA